MTIRQSLLAQTVLAVAAGVYSALVAPSLPATVPTHWGMSGKPDAYGSPVFALWFGPVMGILMIGLTVVLPRLSPKQFEIDRFEQTYATMMLLVSAMIIALHFVILNSTAGKPFDIVKSMMVVFGLFFCFFGNMMGKVRRNFYMGIRTPWTLASERVWEATHRQAATLWFFGGLVVAGLALVGVPFAITFSLFMAIALWPVALSYLLYQKLEK